MVYFFFQAEDGIRDLTVTGVQTCALPISQSQARLVLELLDFLNEPAIVQEEGRARVVVALDQRMADEYFPRFDRVHGPVVHAPLRVQREPVERSALERGNARGLLLPVRRVLMPPDEMGTDSLEPFGLDGGDAARVQARSLGQLRRHDPAPGLPSHTRAGMNPEPDAAGAQII